ncbi:MAG TPA: DUF6807 family protein [Phycisphaerae bacterium]|nr:DUF6807 family protein [Phycisphaerae bacterium]
MLRIRVLVCLLALMAPALTAGAADTKATVSAGNTDRHDTPVSVDLKLTAEQMTQPICVVSDGRTQPAQVEPLADGQARVWWIIDNLPQGTSRTIEIQRGKVSDPPASEAFSWKDTSRDNVKSRDLCFGDRPVLRYMYTPFDGTGKDTIDITRKPYYHVFDPDGSRLITKGEGGLYPHHRGIFYGHNRVKVHGQEKTLDVWSASDAHQIHTKFIREFAGPVLGGHVVTVDWKDLEGKTFATETRTVRVFRSPRGQTLIQFDTTIVTSGGPVALESSNNHHGGVQFRAAQAVAENKQDTRFLRPGKWTTMPADKAIDTEQHPDFKDLPWNATQYKLDDRSYTVVNLCHPKNPRNAEMSERDYGRFGEYSTWKLTKDTPLSLTYRFWVVAAHDVKPAQVDLKAADFSNPPKVNLD